jgi:hypothetical protein
MGEVCRLQGFLPAPRRQRDRARDPADGPVGLGRRPPGDRAPAPARPGQRPAELQRAIRPHPEAFAKLQERQQAAIVTATTPPVTPEEALGFFRRYWGLQHDQFQYFPEGLVDERTFRFWLSARYRDFHSPAPMEIGEITFPRAWEALRAATDLPDPGFFEVMDLAMDVRGTEADRENEAVERAVRHFRENVRA